jgi:hypothetical protein
MKTTRPFPRLRDAAPAALALALMLACSADIFKPSKEPVIKSLSLDLYETDPGETVTATVSASDSKGQELRYEWSVSAGQLLPPLDGTKVKWKVPAVGGVYQITVKVSNDAKSASRSASATVRSPAGPEVKILSPTDGSHRVQHSTLAVSARARHDNGIARVDLFLNRTRKATLNGHAGDVYDFTCGLDEPAGRASVRVEAVANVTGRAASDSVNIFIDGVVPGKAARR